jgi:hypothetical protein
LEKMETSIERRLSRRFTMTLPVTVRSDGPSGMVEKDARTRDVSFRGLYFLTDGEYQAGAHIEFVLKLPKEVTLVGDVFIRCYGDVVRVEALTENGNRGIAARIERYEFLPTATQVPSVTQ